MQPELGKKKLLWAQPKLAQIITSLCTSTRSGISTGREGPVVPVPEPMLPFRD